MKKLIMMAATLIMCFAFSLSVMAAPSPEDEYYNTSTEQEKVDEKTQIDDDEFDKDEKPAKTKTTTTSTSSTSTTSASPTSASPKTSDQGAPVTLVYVSLAAAALAVYAAKHVKEQY